MSSTVLVVEFDPIADLERTGHVQAVQPNLPRVDLLMPITAAVSARLLALIAQDLDGSAVFRLKACNRSNRTLPALIWSRLNSSLAVGGDRTICIHEGIVMLLHLPQ